MAFPKCLFICGTDEDKTKAKSLLRQVYVDTNIPPSDKKLMSGLGSSHGRGGLLGSMFGYGVGDDVKKAAEWVLADPTLTWNATHTRITNMGNLFLCGWSRGAVTCFKVAKLLNPIMPNVVIHIFAIDPVPGNAGSLNTHMYSDISIQGVDRCTIICAELEQRVMFRGVVPPGFIPLGVNGEYIVMPGTHGSVASSAPLLHGNRFAAWGLDAVKHVGGAIVRRLMIEFLRQANVAMGGLCLGETNPANLDLLYCCDYAELMLHYRELKKKGEEKWTFTSHDEGRIVQQKDPTRHIGTALPHGPVLTEKGKYEGQSLESFVGGAANIRTPNSMFVNMDHIARWNAANLPDGNEVILADTGHPLNRAKLGALKAHIAGHNLGGRMASIGQWLVANGL
jgi:hypothetical protein